MRDNIDKVANILMNIGLVMGVYSLYKLYAERSSLPPGVCPINENRSLLYLSLILLIVSLFIPMIKNFKNKKQ